MSIVSQNGSKIVVLMEKEGNEILGITYELLARFSDEVYCVDDPLLETFLSDTYTAVIEGLCQIMSPEVIIMGHTINNLDLAPRLAWRMGAKFVTDCTSVRVAEKRGSLLCTKPVYGDRAYAVFELGNGVKLITIRSKSTERISEDRIEKGRIIKVDIPLDEIRYNVRLIKSIPGESVSLDKADAIVAGGRGVKGTEGLSVLEGLIEILKRFFDKVELGASRPLIDVGLLPKSRQLGQTGEKVTPQLYIAVGISGSSQHVSGIGGSKKIVAVNKDSDAPIYNIADYGVVGPYETVVPALIGKLVEMS
jgi:electron transfer flavoprotein alpha subunit